jgi:hypothetical protein
MGTHCIRKCYEEYELLATNTFGYMWGLFHECINEHIVHWQLRRIKETLCIMKTVAGVSLFVANGL